MCFMFPNDCLLAGALNLHGSQWLLFCRLFYHLKAASLIKIEMTKLVGFLVMNDLLSRKLFRSSTEKAFFLYQARQLPMSEESPESFSRNTFVSWNFWCFACKKEGKLVMKSSNKLLTSIHTIIHSFWPSTLLLEASDGLQRACSKVSLFQHEKSFKLGWKKTLAQIFLFQDEFIYCNTIVRIRGSPHTSFRFWKIRREMGISKRRD